MGRYFIKCAFVFSPKTFPPPPSPTSRPVGRSRVWKRLTFQHWRNARTAENESMSNHEMTSDNRYAVDLERGIVMSEMRRESMTSRSTPRQVTNPLEKAGQICFVCLDRPRDGQYAIQVPCLLAKQSRAVDHWTQEMIPVPDGFVLTGNLSPVYAPLEDWEKFSEDDRAVYIRMVEACFQDLGRWKRWLPYYGVVSLAEVDFQFDGRIGENGRLPGLIIPLDIDEIEKDCKEAIEGQPRPDDLNGYDHCDPAGTYHAQDCETAMKHSDHDCLTKEADEARERLRRLELRYLLTRLARKPADANGLDTLSGMAQGSPIYPLFGKGKVETPVMNELWTGNTAVRALHFVFGFQMDRIKMEVPFLVSVGVLGIGVIWLAVLVSKGAGVDWGMALALAQVVAASISIVITSLRH
ncbi:hypothetical protein B0T14DRAFT_523591 [Immersiella caudata]|uniref:Uncharacterized protein n=1 Tax=Immersiella caudata TaxID=314043 RepID=A0AA39WJS6_9PEZI|nr:hypothetical protein B0T14DRAFT_523591 [Immersiella caudata]